mmetsp:Transcript_29625/g.45782  ORF Transcript_29625/g.45782 Transcript_29625/m.45782 type:complete len:221 (+) Transcript_29625:1709-2371(+)
MPLLKNKFPNSKKARRPLPPPQPPPPPPPLPPPPLLMVPHHPLLPILFPPSLRSHLSKLLLHPLISRLNLLVKEDYQEGEELRREDQEELPEGVWAVVLVVVLVVGMSVVVVLVVLLLVNQICLKLTTPETEFLSHLARLCQRGDHCLLGGGEVVLQGLIKLLLVPLLVGNVELVPLEGFKEEEGGLIVQGGKPVQEGGERQLPSLLRRLQKRKKRKEVR